LYKDWPKYPTILREQDWNKKKGVLAKVLKGKTGISEQLKAAEKAFDKVQPAYFSDTWVDTSSKDSCDKALKALSDHFSGPVKDLCNELLKVKNLATRKEAEFKKNPLIPKASREHVGRIADAAQELTDAVRQHVMDAARDIKQAQAAVAT
jgi:predicted GTPase